MAGAEVVWRIVVRIGSGQPELRAALAALPVRARAERLRQLALVGLYSLRIGPMAETGRPASVPEPDPGLHERRERLLRGLRLETD
jgi:hypothetical protein